MYDLRRFWQAWREGGDRPIAPRFMPSSMLEDEDDGEIAAAIATVERARAEWRWAQTHVLFHEDDDVHYLVIPEANELEEWLTRPAGFLDRPHPEVGW